MRGMGWECGCGKSARECGKSAWKYEKCGESGWRCRESKWKLKYSGKNDMEQQRKLEEKLIEEKLK